MRKLFVAMLSLSACVTQGTYDKLKGENDHTQEELSARNKALEGANKKIDSLEEKGKSLEQALADEKEKKADLDQRLNKALADQASLTKDKSKLQSSVEQMTTALAELEKRRAEAEARIAEFRSLLAKFKTLIDAGKLKVRIVEGRMVVVLATDILFASGSASLSKDGKSAIGEVAQVLASIPKRSFQVEGHTDNVPIATAQFPSNWELAAAPRHQRAQGDGRRRHAQRAHQRRQLCRYPAGRRQRHERGSRAQPPHRNHHRARPLEPAGLRRAAEGRQGRLGDDGQLRQNRFDVGRICRVGAAAELAGGDRFLLGRQDVAQLGLTHRRQRVEHPLLVARAGPANL